MKNKVKELLLKYPEYVQVILELNSGDINLLYDMGREMAVEVLEELSNNINDNNKKIKEEQAPVLYYSDL